MTGMLYVTSSSADHRIINALLLYIRDWEYGMGDSFALITTSTTNNATDIKPTSPPLHSFTNNTWANRSIEAIESFHLALKHSHLYVVLDDEGTRSQTCILGHQPTTRNSETHAWERKEHFQKFRVPWDELYMTWCNIDVANMDFEDFVRERDTEGGGRGGDENEWFEYVNHSAEWKDLSEGIIKLRDAELERLRVAGLV